MRDRRSHGAAVALQALQGFAHGEAYAVADQRRVDGEADAVLRQFVGMQVGQRAAGIDIDHAGNLRLFVKRNDVFTLKHK